MMVILTLKLFIKQNIQFLLSKKTNKNPLNNKNQFYFTFFEG